MHSKKKEEEKIQKLFDLYRDMSRSLTHRNVQRIAPRGLISEEEAKEVNSGRQTEGTIRR